MTDTVLLITKRSTSGKDVIRDRFGRYYHLACGLAESGLQVVVSAADYHHEEDALLELPNVRFISADLSPFTIMSYSRHLAELAAEAQPTYVLAGGDTHFGWFGQRLARKLGVPFVFDVFDNYGAFRSASIPGFRRTFRGLLESADFVTAVSASLAAMVHHDRVMVIPNGVDTDSFYPRPRRVRDLNHGVVVGYVGGVAKDRGLDTLIEAVSRIRQDGIEASLMVVGKSDTTFQVPAEQWIVSVGEVPQDRVPELLTEVDVAVVPYPDTDWARHTSPYKLVEYLSSGVPTVVTDVSSFASMLGVDEAVCRPGDPEDMARAIRYQIEHQAVAAVDDSWSWRARAGSLASVLSGLTLG